MTTNVSRPLDTASLHIESVPLSRIAAAAGTPTYVYSTNAIRRNVEALRRGMQEALEEHQLPLLHPPQQSNNDTTTDSNAISIHYAVKANANLAILQLMHQQGIGFDAVSAGELACVLKACSGLHDDVARDTIFSGVGKTDEEIAVALRVGVKYICVESAAEVDAVSAVAQRVGACSTAGKTGTTGTDERRTSTGAAAGAPIAIRVNPDVDAQSHPYISTGLKENKFGVPMDEAEALCLRANRDPWLRVVGVSCHIGSQITSLAPFRDAARRMAVLTRRLLDAGLPLVSVSMGGGLGVRYEGLNLTNDEGHRRALGDDVPPPSVGDYGRVLVSELGSLGLQILLEPGRVLVADAGLLLSRVVRTKAQEGRRFVILDSAMNDLLRPALYGARHAVEAVEAVGSRAGNHEGDQKDGRHDETDDGQEAQEIVGPVCESGDTFYASCRTPGRRLEAGELVVLHTAGAYGMSMASNYNGRRRVAEVLVDGTEIRIVRQREGFADLWRGQCGLDGQAMDTEVPMAGDEGLSGW